MSTSLTTSHCISPRVSIIYHVDSEPNYSRVKICDTRKIKTKSLNVSTGSRGGDVFDSRNLHPCLDIVGRPGVEWFYLCRTSFSVRRGGLGPRWKNFLQKESESELSLRVHVRSPYKVRCLGRVCLSVFVVST